MPDTHSSVVHFLIHCITIRVEISGAFTLCFIHILTNEAHVTLSQTYIFRRAMGLQADTISIPDSQPCQGSTHIQTMLNNYAALLVSALFSSSLWPSSLSSLLHLHLHLKNLARTFIHFVLLDGERTGQRDDWASSVPFKALTVATEPTSSLPLSPLPLPLSVASTPMCLSPLSSPPWLNSCC